MDVPGHRNTTGLLLILTRGRREHKRRVHQYLDLERLYLQLRRHPDSTAPQHPQPITPSEQSHTLGKRKAPEPYEPPAPAAAVDPAAEAGLAEAGKAMGGGAAMQRLQQQMGQQGGVEGGRLERFSRMLTISTRCSTLKVRSWGLAVVLGSADGQGMEGDGFQGGAGLQCLVQQLAVMKGAAEEGYCIILSVYTGRWLPRDHAIFSSI